MRELKLLELLTLRVELQTPQAWAAALQDGVEAPGALPGTQEAAEAAERAPLDPPSSELLGQLEAIVPRLPEYSALSPQIEALLGYCAARYPVETDHVVRRWVQSTPASVPFRRWLLDWLKCSHVSIISSSGDLETKLRWRHALFAAAAKESEPVLRHKLLQFLETLESSLDSTPGPTNNGESDEMATRTLEPIDTVEALLDFCWLHAENLAPFAALCAAKLHALVLKTRENSPKQLLEAEEVVVRLRWALQLKPLLFRPLLEHCAALKVFPAREVWSRLRLGEELGGFVQKVDLVTRERIQNEMRETRERLEQAYTSGAEHVHGCQRQTDRQPCFFAGEAVASYLAQLSLVQKKVLLEELESDLDEASRDMFPHVFQFFGLFMGVLLASPGDRDKEVLVLVLATRALFAVFERRSHDDRSCLDAVGLLLDLSMANHRFWERRPDLFLRVAEPLCDCMALQPDRKTQWATRMALQQLLFECSSTVLRANSGALSSFLPRALKRLLDIRLGA